MKLNDDDFGFSLVSEQELKAHEEMLKKKVEEQSKVVQQTAKKMEETAAQAQDKLHGLRNMIMPLLTNLAKDPDKTYILWPDRAEKIQKFIKKIDDYVMNDD
jgi:hypothetical protein